MKPGEIQVKYKLAEGFKKKKKKNHIFSLLSSNVIREKLIELHRLINYI